MLLDEAWPHIVGATTRLAAKSKEGYAGWWRDFVRFVRSLNDGAEAIPLPEDRQTLLLWEQSLRERLITKPGELSPEHLSGRTIATAIGCVKGCYKALDSADLLGRNPTHVVYVTRRDREGDARRVITTPELQRLVAWILAHPDSYLIIVYYLLLLVGLRHSEIQSLTWWRALGSKHLKVLGKGGVTREVPRPPILTQLMERLRAYAAQKGDLDYVFAGRGPGRPMALQTMRDHWIYPARHIIPDLNPHTMRRTMAEVLATMGVPLDQIQATLGHSEITTTMDYLKTHGKNLTHPTNALNTWMVSLAASSANGPPIGIVPSSTGSPWTQPPYVRQPPAPIESADEPRQGATRSQSAPSGDMRSTDGPFPFE